MKYAEWFNEWLDLFVKINVRESTLKKYIQNYRLYIFPVLGDREMDEIAPIELQKFVGDMIKKGLSPGTVNSVISLLKRSLKKATSMGFLDRNHADEIVRPRSAEREVTCFTRVEQRKIERFILGTGSDRLFGIVLTLYTGLRIGELLALAWSDVDLKHSYLRINKSCSDSWEKGTYVKNFFPPKTKSSVRIIPIPKQICEQLKIIKKRAKGEYVVPGRTSYGSEIRSYQYTFANILKKLNLPPRCFHSLRHTFATRALECGMDVRSLAEIMGHKNPDITLRRYAHSILEHKAECMNKIGKLFE